MDLPSQNIGHSDHPETRGFDLSAGNTWIYPENYPVRQYQFDIVKSALYCNTLVCLPTGLGKTFIAAVVMYNFWRWYPIGKIVFLAPTKPLVAQQINACYEVMGISSEDMMELTGAVSQKTREKAWGMKRIIFATPQVFHNDLEKAIVPSHAIKCVVLDEAHRALGKYSYCECIKILSTQNQYFRILALSATPGNKLDNVHEVIQNLHISRLELKDENSSDIVPYINKRKVDIILVPLSNELLKFKEKYIFIMDPHVRFLIGCNVMKGQTANISKGRIFHLLRDFKTRTDKSGNYGQIMKSLNILLTMYHAYDLLIRHGLRAFFHFYQTHSDKFWMREEAHLQDLLHEIETYLGPFPEIYPNGEISETPTNIVFGHNKFHKLKELLEHHFRKNNNNDEKKDTRAIVFVEFRDIVNEVYVLLMQSKPLIRPQMFVGQAGQKQKQQLQALEDFRSNRVNVLISTSIGEEGLDVGEVDLIICFDVSQHSPIRLVQRMGRTGRKRDGHIIVLVTDGKEHENLKSTFSKRDSLNNKILNTSNISSSLYTNNPRMIPDEFNPECHKRHIVLPMTQTVKNKKKWKAFSKKTSETSISSKKKVLANKSETSTSKQKESSTTKKDTAGQPSMMRFLTNQFGEPNNVAATQSRSQNLLHNTIRPDDVKLLSDDNIGIEFLTLCAIKKSEEDMSSSVAGSSRKMDTTYVPAAKPIGDLFNFAVPDVSAIDLSFVDFGCFSLTQKCATMYDADNQPLTQSKLDNDHCFWGTCRNERDIGGNNAVRFEDIMDESSDSDATELSCRSQQRFLDAAMTTDVIVAPDEARNEEVTNARTDTPVFEDMETSMFEDILNESFSMSEDEAMEPPSSSDIVAKNTKETRNATREDTDFRITDKNNTIESNRDRPASVMESGRSMRTSNFTDALQDCYFDSDDDINQFVRRDESGGSVAARDSKTNETLFSVTQAIGEIARMRNNNAGGRPLPSSSVSKKKPSLEVGDTGWITVDTKCETETRKATTNINSVKESPCPLENVEFPDEDFDFSDEDFAIVRKFDEIESGYFRDDESRKKDSRNSEVAKSVISSPDIVSPRNVKPRGMSTPTFTARRPLLSLNRNRIQQSGSGNIDLSSFRAPDKRNANVKENNITEPGPSRRITNSRLSLISNRYASDSVRDKSESESSGLELSKRNLASPMSNNKIERKKIEPRRKRKNRDVRNEFIDDEAVVDGFDTDLSSDEETEVNLMDERDDRDDLADFVSYTQFTQEGDVDMQAHYLRTVRSPIKRPGAFCFKAPRTPDSPVLDIYSQPLTLSQAEDTYLYDSFCVMEDEANATSVHDDSVLEQVERELERQRRKRVGRSDKRLTKVRKTSNEDLNQSVSSEDEIEMIRAQVREND